MAFVLCVTASQAIADSEIKIELRSNRISEIDVGKAVEVFRGACRPLGGYYWQNLEEITATAFDEYAPHRLAKGWKTTIHLSGRKSDGDTVHYDIGGGRSPGFFAGKDVAKWLCSMNDTMGTGADAFVPVPALNFLP